MDTSGSSPAKQLDNESLTDPMNIIAKLALSSEDRSEEIIDLLEEAASESLVVMGRLYDKLSNPEEYLGQLALHSVKSLFRRMQLGNPAAEEMAKKMITQALDEIYRAIEMIMQTHEQLATAQNWKESEISASPLLLEGKDYVRPSGNTNPFKIEPEWLRGAAKFVYDYWKRTGFPPRITVSPHVIMIEVPRYAKASKV